MARTDRRYDSEVPKLQEDTATLTPNTFVRTAEFDFRSLGKALASTLKYGSNKELSEDKVWYSMSELMEDCCFRQKQIVNVARVSKKRFNNRFVNKEDGPTLFFADIFNAKKYCQQARQGEKIEELIRERTEGSSSKEWR